MHEEDMKTLMSVEEILEKELRQEMEKVKEAGQFSPGQTKTITDAVCLMLKMKEYEEWLNGEGMSETAQRNAGRMSYGNNSYGGTSYARSRNTGRFISHNMPPMYGSSYERNYSGHSTRDKMIAALEDLMGEVKNEYEAQMIMEAINHIQRGESR